MRRPSWLPSWLARQNCIDFDMLGETADHEGVHAVAAVEVRGFEQGLVATIDPFHPMVSPRSLGVVSIAGCDQTRRRTMVPGELDESQRQALLIASAVDCYGGAAVQRPDAPACFFPDDRLLLRQCEDDRRIFCSYARAMGYMAADVDHRAWVRACRFVDSRWGAIRAVAEELLREGTLEGPRIAEIIATAPHETNERPRDPDDPGNYERRFSWAGDDVVPWLPLELYS